MLPKTRSTLGDQAHLCESRSLFQSRFADPQAKEDARKTWFKNLISKSAEKISHASWLPDHATVLHARLMSRLLIDLGGGVMENANLGLDRYGLPHIPGSAVKGLARRMALQALHDWIESASDRPAADDACAPCCEGFENPSAMLAAIARIFGWTKEDWSSKKSDFAWACEKNISLLTEARQALPAYETFAGSIAFLGTSPNSDPELELDVLTPHHTKYYEGTLPVATDTEDPIPVFFPAVKAQTEGNFFTFPLIPLSLAQAEDIVHAKSWLAHGLELLGLGAKTHAGYGFFQVTENQTAIFPNRFKPRLSPSQEFISAWGAKALNSMSAKIFCKQTVGFDACTLIAILDVIAPGKSTDFKDSFWTPFKTDTNGRIILEKIRSTL